MLNVIKGFLSIAILIFLTTLLVSCSKVPRGYPGRIMVLSISSDGKYAISTSISKHAILWNLSKRTYKIISKDANIYSAYFIKGTNTYLYQDDSTNEVIVKNINGKNVKKIALTFPTYGDVMTTDHSKLISAAVISLGGGYK